jgi:hypothetical protein
VWLFSLLLAAIPVAIAIVAYTGYVVWRSSWLYDQTKLSRRGWIGRVHRNDPALGLAPVPGARGAHTFPIGPDLPMRFDENGFRVPADRAPEPDRRPLLLALGCSFTYGDATAAEETFPYLLGKAIGGTAKNAGVCGCGLAQMLLLARRLIPSLRPDWLVVQYSPWLTDRAMAPFAPSYEGRLPTPYFAEDLSLQRPVFQSKLLDLDFDSYRRTPKSAAEFLSFFWRIGLPLSLYDHVNMASYGIRAKLGRVPAPARDGTEVERAVYQEIAHLARGVERSCSW